MGMKPEGENVPEKWKTGDSVNLAESILIYQLLQNYLYSNSQ